MTAAYRTYWVPAAVRELQRLGDRSAQERVLRAVKALETDPRPPTAARLSGTAAPFYRLRVGVYRVLYAVRDGEAIVVALHVGHRREVYQGARDRIADRLRTFLADEDLT